MATGIEHEKATIKATPYISMAVACLAYAFHSSDASTFVFALLSSIYGCILGTILSPDLDIKHQTLSERRVIEVNKKLGIAFMLYWYPYAIAIPHRHWLSHMPIIGTSIRVVYAFWWIPVVAFFYRDYMIVGVFLEVSVACFVALCSVDLLHWAMDR